MVIRFSRVESIRKQLAKYSPTTNVSEFWIPLTLGREYVVCAIAFNRDDIHYFVVNDDALPWPMPYCASAFEIVDARISEHWSFAFTPMNPDFQSILSFQDWVQDAHFYDRLLDGETDAVRSFNRFLSPDGAERSARG